MPGRAACGASASRAPSALAALLALTWGTAWASAPPAQMEVGGSPGQWLPPGLVLFVLGVLFAIAAVPIALSVWLGRAGRENLWLSWLSLCLAANTLVISGWPRLWTDDTGWLARTETVSGHLAAACTIQFLWPFLRRPIGPVLRSYQWSHLALAAFAGLWPSLSVVLATGPIRFLWLLPLLVAAALLIGGEAYRGSSEARLLALAGVLFIAAEIYELGHVWLDWPRPGVSLVPFGFAAVLVALWLGEAIRVRRNQRDLEELRVSLEHRVAERTRSLHEARLEAVEAARARDEFVLTLSHEVRNPLYSILGLADWLMDREPPPLEQVLVEMIRGSGRSLVALLDSVLDVARLAESQPQARKAPFDPRATVEAVMDMAAPMVWDRRIELTSNVAPDVPAILVGDGERLSEVLFNLVSNAAKFTHQGGVDVYVSFLRTAGSAGELQCRVEDTGPGIPQDLMPALFEPFWKDGGEARGSGLGLAICRRLVDVMGGRLWVEPQPEGSGTIFHFTARMVALSDEMQALLARLHEVGELHVLILEPDAGARSLLKERLVALGMHPKGFGDTEGAVGWLRSGRRADLVIVSSRVEAEARQSLSTAVGGLGDAVAVLEAPARFPEWEAPEATVFFAELLQLAEGRRTPPDEEPEIAALRVLVVEDDEINLEITHYFLQRLGQSSEGATSEEEAMLALSRDRFDVVILDLGLGEGSGLNVARRIRAELPTERQPFIAALTGRADAPTRDACVEAGMDEFLTKPIELKDLAAVLHAGRPLRRRRQDPVIPGSGETPDQAVLDQVRLAVLAELGEAGREDVLGKLIDSFLDSSNLELATMLQAATQDRRKLSEVAHRLAGRSANLGLNRVTTLCRKLELVAHSAEPRHLLRMLQSLGEELDEAARALSLQRTAEADPPSGGEKRSSGPASSTTAQPGPRSIVES